MSGIHIRCPTDKDTTALQHLCRLIDPDDYAQEAWPTWLKMPHAVNLVAEHEGKIVACRHLESLTETEAWSQGVRVHPEWRRRGLASRLLETGRSEISRKGIQILRASTATHNTAGQSYLEKNGFSRIAEIFRRQIPGRHKRKTIHILPTSQENVTSLLQKYPVLASRSHLALFKRVYFSPTNEYLKKLAESRALLRSPDGDAFAFLDPGSTLASNRIWVTALAGSASGMYAILENLVIEAGPDRILVVDSPGERLSQKAMDELGFRPSGYQESYIIFEQQLISQAQNYPLNSKNT